jgi:hypothetical protein
MPTEQAKPYPNNVKGIRNLGQQPKYDANREADDADPDWKRPPHMTSQTHEDRQKGRHRGKTNYKTKSELAPLPRTWIPIDFFEWIDHKTKFSFLLFSGGDQ